MKDIIRQSKASKSNYLRRVTGGRAHSDEEADRALVKKMVKPEARTGYAKGGGALKHKNKGTQINVIVAPRPDDRATPAGPVVVPVRQGPQAAPGVVPSRPPAQPPIKVQNVPPPQGPLGPVQSRRGGRIEGRANGGGVKFTGGAAEGIGRLEKIDAQKRK